MDRFSQVYLFIFEPLRWIMTVWANSTRMLYTRFQTQRLALTPPFFTLIPQIFFCIADLLTTHSIQQEVMTFSEFKPPKETIFPGGGLKGSSIEMALVINFI